MPICVVCGEEFDLAAVRRKFSREYFKGVYDQCYPALSDHPFLACLF